LCHKAMLRRFGKVLMLGYRQNIMQLGDGHKIVLHKCINFIY
jgi:hypothetical protein